MIESYEDLRRLTRDLETIADWKDELQAKAEALEAEVLKFKQVCAALSGNPQHLQQRRAA